MKYECKKLFLKVECLCEKLDKGKSPEEIAVELHVVKIKERLDKNLKIWKGLYLDFFTNV